VTDVIAPAPATGDAILIVDDEKNIRRTLRMVLDSEGHVVHEAGSAAEAIAVLEREPVELILLDVKLGEDNGIELLRTLKARGDDGVGGPAADIPVVMISGHATIEDAVAATRLGAFDFMEKPLDRNRVMVTVKNALDRRRMWREVNQLRRAVDARWELLGSTPVMNDLRRQIVKVAPTRSRVLITGGSGTGKELIARAIHRNSAVSSGPFVKVNCAAIPPELIESELFGHERGAFTGAVAKKRGLFEVADGGTIFLDEIGDMTLPAQAKVLRVLQTGEFTRVGGEKSLRTDSRVVAATNRDLEEMVKAGTFREDLFFRLNVVPIRSPDLNERADDVPLLVDSFVAECCDENGFAKKPIDDVGLRAPQGLRLAGQRPRAAQRGRAPRHHERRGDPRARPAAVPGRAAQHRRPHHRAGRRAVARQVRRQVAARVPRGDRERVHPHEARRAQLEHLEDRPGAGHRAHQPAQEAARARHPPRRRRQGRVAATGSG
jgi:two-component system nitrogen regulation response regulator NtrX